MTSQEEVSKALDAIVKRQIEAISKVATEDNMQLDTDVETLLINTIKEQIKMSLDNLGRLYEEFIDKDDCTLKTALEFIPLFSVNGLINGAQLGVTQEEYYMIVDHYLERYNLLKE